MKKILWILLIFGFQFANAQVGSWTVWKQSPCYLKIEYRYRYVKQQGDRHVWLLQFKNNYNKSVYFNYSLAGEQEEEQLYLARRKSITPNRNSDEMEFFTNSESFEIQVSNLSFRQGVTEYEPCDQNKRSKD